jgi:hypothetical protein
MHLSQVLASNCCLAQKSADRCSATIFSNLNFRNLFLVQRAVGAAAMVVKNVATGGPIIICALDYILISE